MPDETKSQESVLQRFFDQFRQGESFLILTHDHPDPDSISSAAALREIASFIGQASTTVAYGGIIGRTENAHMVKYLRMNLRPIDRVRIEDYNHIALVDTQPGTGNNSLPPRRIPDLVIDHHPMIAPTRKVPFADVREGYGATASILAEYLFKLGIQIDRNLATALLYGIKSETQDLGREAYQIDTECYMKLFPLANKKLLGKIVNSRVPQSYYSWIQDAIENAQIVGNALVTRLGEVDTPDIIPEVADLMLRMQGMVWAFCVGQYKDAVVLSMRTTNIRKNAGSLMKRLVRGKGSGGGHGLIAGGKIDVPGLEPWQIHDLENELEENFLRMIHRDDRPRVPLVGEDGERRKGSKTRSLVLVR
ncbi:MAG TPA: DHHA1 domain-containing protein [Bdellovibrionota bacterium]|nr:DHHA1 domain-containing protein [Bdellovibrionota bacterium]